MSAPTFLSVEDVLAIHAHQIARFGGGDGLRDVGLLESAVAQAQASFDGEYVHEVSYPDEDGHQEKHYSELP